MLDVFDPDSGEPNDRVAVGTVLGMPEVTLPDDTVALAEATTANVFFGRRGAGADILLTTPEPLTSASVSLTIIDDQVDDVSLPHGGEGMYVATSLEASNLEYRPGAAYRTTIVESGRTYEMDVERAPSPATPLGVPEIHQAGEPMTVSWSEQGTALIEVHRFTSGGANRTFTNRPSDVRDLIHLALQKEQDEAGLEIPGEAFQNEGSYVLILYVLRRGFPDSGLFAGSSLMVGVGATARFEVSP